LANRRLRREHFADGALGILEGKHLRNARGRIVARVTADAFRLDAAADVVEVGLRRDLECQAFAARVLAVVELNHEVAELGREVSAAVFPLRQDQAGDVREIGDLALEIGCLEGDVAEALGLDHGVLRIVDCIGLEFTGASRGWLIRDQNL
jgi:hypothetical protein